MSPLSFLNFTRFLYICSNLDKFKKTQSALNMKRMISVEIVSSVMKERSITIWKYNDVMYLLTDAEIVS